MSPIKSSWVRAIALLACGLIRLPNTLDLFETEFGGGTLTGPLIILCLIGCACFVLGVAATFVSARTAAALAALGALLSIPLDLYRLAPRSLAWLSSAPPSISVIPDMRWDTASLAHLAAIAVMAAILVRTSSARQALASPKPGSVAG